MIKATFAVDFTTATVNPQITISRAGGTATRVNSAGLIEGVGADIARFDYDSSSLVCKGLLIEEQRTNLVRYSEDFGNAYWTASNSSLESNTVVAPDGTLTGDKLVENTAASVGHKIESSAFSTGIVSGINYTFSAYVKSAGRNWAVLEMQATLGGGYAWFDLSNGTVGTQVNLSGTSTITPVGNGWYRCSITDTSTGGGSAATKCAIFTANANSVVSYTGDGTSGIFIWGAQLEAGSFATSYIPTTTTALTRNADVATISGTAFSGIWRSGSGSLLVRALPSTVSGTRPLVQVDDATADNIIALRGNTTNPELYIRAGGADQATIDAGTISAAAYRLAGAWKAGNGVATLNGFAPVKGTPASIPAVTQMRLGSDGTNYLNGHLQSLEYWDEFLTPATLQSVTTSAGYRSIVGPVMRDTIIA